MAVRDTEVLILGGGPAGGSAARLLALWGHAVTLVARPAAGESGASLAESLTPSCQKLFDQLNIGDAIERAGFIRSGGNTVWWGRGEPRIEPFGGGARGWQATSAALEETMIGAAREAGAQVERRLVTADDAARMPARFRIDATGRAGLLARHRGRRTFEPAHRTIALAGTWVHTGAWPLPDPSHTLLESYVDGWAWSVPLDERRRAVAVMVDPRSTAMTRGEGSRTAYLAEIGKTERFASLLADARLEHGPDGWDASMYSSARYAGDDWLLAGDAASFVDPLSSAGVKKALSSGWLAAIAVHTALIKPSMAPVALRFFADREAAMYSGFLALTRAFLSQGASDETHPFWADRADAEEAGAEASRARLEADGARAAYERIRAAPELRLRPADDVRTELRPAIGGAEIVLESRIVTDELPAGTRFLHDVDVVALLDLAPGFGEVPHLYEAYVRRCGPVDLASFLTALATLVARRWLIER